MIFSNAPPIPVERAQASLLKAESLFKQKKYARGGTDLCKGRRDWACRTR